MTIYLADLDFRSKIGVIDNHAAQGDVLAQDGGAGSARDYSHLTSADMHAIPRGRGLVTFELKSHEPPGRLRLAPKQCRPANEVHVSFSLKRNGKPNTGLEWVNLFVELLSSNDKSRLYP